MATNIKSIVKQASDFCKDPKNRKSVIIGAVLAVVVAGGIIGALLLNKSDYTVLYSGLSAEEAGTVMTALETMGVEAKVEGEDTILVPAEQADGLRIKLAADGYPSTGLNYDIFTDAADIAATDSEELTYKQYQLQENMRTTIAKMDKVKDCIVIVNLATSSSYVVSSNTSQASVSILVEVEDGQTLTDPDAKSMAKFAMTCVPDLKMENISIVDTNMHYYDVLADDEEESLIEYSGTQQQLTQRMKDILSEQVITVLAPAVGYDNIAVSVNLTLNFDAETVKSVEFSPPVEGMFEGLIRSSEEIYDAVNAGDYASGQPGTDSNGVSAGEYVNEDETEAGPLGSYDNIYNYELNQVEKEIKRAQGKVENLSVSVLINSNIEGIADHLDTVENLVANAIGVNEEYITVGMMPFVQGAGLNLGDYLQQSGEQPYGQSDLIKLAIIAGAALLLLALIIVLLMLKIRRNNRKKKAEEAAQTVEAAAGEPVSEETAQTEEENLLEELMLKKSDQAEKVEELMDKYPDTVAQVLRNWLTED